MPHRSSTGSLQEVEEERRLLYVGITRAQEELFFVHCESRMRFGRTEYTRPSRFLEDIPEGTLVDIDVFGRDLSDSGLNKFPRRTWRPPSIEVATGSTQITSFRGGEKVEHPRYGAGTVVGVSGEGMGRDHGGFRSGRGQTADGQVLQPDHSAVARSLGMDSNVFLL